MQGAGAERRRLADADRGGVPWRAWGPYLAERAWGTVREDPGDGRGAWDAFPHDHARSRAYRWSEDGLAGVCDDRQLFCFGLALWNGVDPILKERVFGLSNTCGNHGEDAKEYWWYLDSTPTHSWMRWRLHYPQRAFPYAGLAAVNESRGCDEPEYELVDTGVFDSGEYWVVEVDYAKAAPTDLCVRITLTNCGPRPATVDVLPTLWFRNTWSWGTPDGGDPPARPVVRAADETGLPAGVGASLLAAHPLLGTLTLVGDGTPTVLCCDNETNGERIHGRPGARWPKDGINDHVVHGAPTVNPARTGTKAALRYRRTVPAGGRTTIRLRLRPEESGRPTDPWLDFADVLAARQAEADAFFAELVPASATAEEATLVRRAVAGTMWAKQFYHYDVDRWHRGDPGTEPPRRDRNHHWRHLAAHDILAVPDPWEYPWFAAWDLAFTCVAVARVDPTFAKEQLLALLGERYVHPDGRIPACEWDFGDPNPPVHAWAALRVYALDGARDRGFLARVLDRLRPTFAWWAERIDATGGVLAGGFLGLDNVAPFNRSEPPPVPGRLDQCDAAAWTALAALNLAEIAGILAAGEYPDAAGYRALAAGYLAQFAAVADTLRAGGVWHDADGFCYDVLRMADGSAVPLRVRSVVGLLPVLATAVLDDGGGRDGARLYSLLDRQQLVRVLHRMLDPDEFLSPYGLRSLSRAHRDQPYTIQLDGEDRRVGYEPGESSSRLFGGNSNWRGPVWFPVNVLLVDALHRLGGYFGADLRVPYPTGSGRLSTLDDVAADLADRLVGLFLADGQGRRPVLGDVPLFRHDPGWRDLVPFHEYFHGDTGAGLGAAHQTGWTALVAELLLQRAQARPSGSRRPFTAGLAAP